jgi:RNase H-fold protein (predicted Holliday junction resolvase)
MLEAGGVSGKKRKTKVDKIAAVLILQTYLDSQIRR